MEFREIQPYVRYAHYIPIDVNQKYDATIPYDNRMFYMYKGAGEIMVENNVFSMQEGDVLVVPSGTEYQIMSVRNRCTFIAINFDYTQSHYDKKAPVPPARIWAYNPSMLLEKSYFTDAEDFNGVVFIKGMDKLSVRFMRVEREYTNKLRFYEQIISKIIAEILLECARNLYGEKYNSNKEITNIVIAYINENFYMPITNQLIGKEFNLHPNYISNLIKVSTGMPLHQYLINTRVSKSVELLSQGRYSISEIAERCGFCDIYHYSKAFKKIMGISPSKYLQ